MPGTILQKLYSEDAKERRNAIIELGVTGNESAISSLKQLSNAKDPSVSYFAKKSIAQIESRIAPKASKTVSLVKPIEKARVKTMTASSNVTAAVAAAKNAGAICKIPSAKKNALFATEKKFFSKFKTAMEDSETRGFAIAVLPLILALFVLLGPGLIVANTLFILLSTFAVGISFSVVMLRQE
jgi:hypothetical protein